MIGDKLTKLVRESSPKSDSSANVRFLRDIFQEDDGNREIFFCKSNLFHRLRYSQRDKSGTDPPPAPASFEDRQLSAKLHCLYGVPIQHLGLLRSSRTYPFACSKVYDLRNYTRETMWGPFMEDGSGYVDWERIEAILVVLAHNLRIFEGRQRTDYGAEWRQAFEGCAPNSYTSRDGPRPDISGLSLAAKDPYNITGTWHRVSSLGILASMLSVNPFVDCYIPRYCNSIKIA